VWLVKTSREELNKPIPANGVSEFAILGHIHTYVNGKKRQNTMKEQQKVGKQKMEHENEISGLISRLLDSDYKEKYEVTVQLCNYLALIQKINKNKLK
jgi:hypothetical protein